MEFGICVPHYGKPVDIASTLGVARSAEELGFASVWVTDHLFVPRTMEIIYRDNMLEPLALLSHLAAVVSRVRLGTSVLILPYRNPIIVAKMLATIDQLSHGRLIFGAAVGWMEEEFHALKVPFAERGALSDESLRIIRAHWSGGAVNHQGTFYRYSDMQASPRPVQQPGPPIWIGGNSARARRRVAALGDGWHSSSLNAAAMAPGCAHVRELWEKHGRQGQPVFSARTDLTIAAFLTGSCPIPRAWAASPYADGRERRGHRRRPRRFPGNRRGTYPCSRPPRNRITAPWRPWRRSCRRCNHSSPETARRCALALEQVSCHLYEGRTSSHM